MHSARGFADKQYTSILYTILQIIAKNIARTRQTSPLTRLAEPIRAKLHSWKDPASKLRPHFCAVGILLGNLKKVEVGHKLLYYALRALHKIEAICKKSLLQRSLG